MPVILDRELEVKLPEPGECSNSSAVTGAPSPTGIFLALSSQNPQVFCLQVCEGPKQSLLSKLAPEIIFKHHSYATVLRTRTTPTGNAGISQSRKRGQELLCRKSISP